MGLLRAIKLIWIISIFISIGFITGLASADLLLYGTTSNGDSGTSTLVTINPSDGNLLDTIGSGVGYLVNGMAWDYQAQSLYASTSINDPTFTGLIVIDRTTGEGRIVGTRDWGQNAGFSVSNITIDSDGNMVGWADGTNQLVEIDKATGKITAFTDTSVSAVDFGLSYDKYDLLYLINNGDSGDLYVFVDDAQDFSLGDRDSSIGCESRQGDFHPTSNLYYGIDYTGTDTRKLVTIDVASKVDNFKESFDTVPLLHTLAFAVTGSSNSSGDSGNCFIRSIIKDSE